MSSLKSMPVGYRFHPTDVELVNHYLKLKNQGSDRDVSNIQVIDVCKWEPSELPGLLGSESDDQEWYFFGRRDTKYGKSTRANRATKDGFWKPTGNDRNIKMGSKKVLIGTKKTLVFHKGHARKAVRTYWVMHEYRASVDKNNPQAFVLYLLRKKSDENPDLPISDGADPNRSSPSASLVNNAPSHSLSTPTVLQGLANFSSSDQSRLNQNWKEQEVSSSHDQNYAFDSALLEDDIDFQAFESCFDGQQPTWEGLERMLPAIPLSNINPNQGPIHTTARYLNVSNNDHEVVQFLSMMRRQGIVNRIDSGGSIFMGTPETVSLDSESGTETDNDVPQSLFGEDALHGGSAYHSDSESSDQEFYNDMILAHEVSLSINSGIVQRVELDAGPKKPITSGAHGTAATNLRTRSYSEVPAQASGKKEYGNVPPKTSESKILNAVSDDSSVESLSEAKSFRVAENESSGRLGGNSHNMAFIVYADNPRVNNGTTPLSDYIKNIAIGIFLTVVITGEVLFGLVS